MLIENSEGHAAFQSYILRALNDITQLGEQEARWEVRIDTGDLDSSIRQLEPVISASEIRQDIAAGGTMGPVYKRIVTWAELNNTELTNPDGIGFMDAALDIMISVPFI